MGEVQKEKKTRHQKGRAKKILLPGEKAKEKMITTFKRSLRKAFWEEIERRLKRWTERMAPEDEEAPYEKIAREEQEMYAEDRKPGCERMVRDQQKMDDNRVFGEDDYDDPNRERIL